MLIKGSPSAGLLFLARRVATNARKEKPGIAGLGKLW
jgi:hypothetical protein